MRPQAGPQGSPDDAKHRPETALTRLLTMRVRILPLDRLCEIGEELVGQFLGGTVDQALAELGELAADLRLDVVAQERAAVLVGERHGGAAFGEAGNPALALARDL